MNYNYNMGINYVGSTDNIGINITIGSSGAYSINSNFSKNVIKNSTINDTVEFNAGYVFADSEQRSLNHDNTLGNHWIFAYGATCNYQTTTKHDTEPGSWKTIIGSTYRTSIYPFKLELAQVAAEQGKAVTVKCWVKKDHATNIACRLIAYGDTITGVTETYDTKANDTDWEELSITFTPNGGALNMPYVVIPIYLETYYVSGNSNSYAGKVTISQA